MKGQFRRWPAPANGQVRQDKFLEPLKAQFGRNLPPARRFRHFRLPKKGLRRSHVCGMNCEVPPLNEAIKTGDATGDRFWTGRFVPARGIAGPAAQPGHDPAEPSQTREWMRGLL